MKLKYYQFCRENPDDASVQMQNAMDLLFSALSEITIPSDIACGPDARENIAKFLDSGGKLSLSEPLAGKIRDFLGAVSHAMDSGGFIERVAESQGQSDWLDKAGPLSVYTEIKLPLSDS